MKKSAYNNRRSRSAAKYAFFTLVSPIQDKTRLGRWLYVTGQPIQKGQERKREREKLAVVQFKTITL